MSSGNRNRNIYSVGGNRRDKRKKIRLGRNNKSRGKRRETKMDDKENTDSEANVISDAMMFNSSCNDNDAIPNANENPSKREQLLKLAELMDRNKKYGEKRRTSYFYDTFGADPNRLEKYKRESDKNNIHVRIPIVNGGVDEPYSRHNINTLVLDDCLENVLPAIPMLDVDYVIKQPKSFGASSIDNVWADFATTLYAVILKSQLFSEMVYTTIMRRDGKKMMDILSSYLYEFKKKGETCVNEHCTCQPKRACFTGNIYQLALSSSTVTQCPLFAVRCYALTVQLYGIWQTYAFWLSQRRNATKYCHFDGYVNRVTGCSVLDEEASLTQQVYKTLYGFRKICRIVEFDPVRCSIYATRSAYSDTLRMADFNAYHYDGLLNDAQQLFKLAFESKNFELLKTCNLLTLMKMVRNCYVCGNICRTTRAWRWFIERIKDRLSSFVTDIFNKNILNVDHLVEEVDAEYIGKTFKNAKEILQFIKSKQKVPNSNLNPSEKVVVEDRDRIEEAIVSQQDIDKIDMIPPSSHRSTVYENKDEESDEGDEGDEWLSNMGLNKKISDNNTNARKSDDMFTPPNSMEALEFGGIKVPPNPIERKIVENDATISHTIPLTDNVKHIDDDKNDDDNDDDDDDDDNEEEEDDDENNVMCRLFEKMILNEKKDDVERRSRDTESDVGEERSNMRTGGDHLLSYSGFFDSNAYETYGFLNHIPTNWVYASPFYEARGDSFIKSRRDFLNSVVVFFKLWFKFKLFNASEQLEADIVKTYIRSFVSKYDVRWYEYEGKNALEHTKRRVTVDPERMLDRMYCTLSKTVKNEAYVGLEELHENNRCSSRFGGFSDWYRLVVSSSSIATKVHQFFMPESHYALHGGQWIANMKWFYDVDFPFIYYHDGRYKVFHNGYNVCYTRYPTDFKKVVDEMVSNKFDVVRFASHRKLEPERISKVVIVANFWKASKDAVMRKDLSYFDNLKENDVQMFVRGTLYMVDRGYESDEHCYDSFGLFDIYDAILKEWYRELNVNKSITQQASAKKDVKINSKYDFTGVCFEYEKLFGERIPLNYELDDRIENVIFDDAPTYKEQEKDIFDAEFNDDSDVLYFDNAYETLCVWIMLVLDYKTDPNLATKVRTALYGSIQGLILWCNHMNTYNNDDVIKKMAETALYKNTYMVDESEESSGSSSSSSSSSDCKESMNAEKSSMLEKEAEGSTPKEGEEVYENDYESFKNNALGMQLKSEELVAFLQTVTENIPLLRGALKYLKRYEYA